MSVFDRLRGAAYLGQLWLRRPGLKRAYGELRRLEKAPEEELRGIQRNRLEAILRHASLNVPYYQELLRDLGIVSGEGEVDLERFEALPVLGKRHLREHWSALQSEVGDRHQWYLHRTGGSTGEPARILQDRSHRDTAVALTLVFDEWTGYRFGEPRVALWGSRRDVLRGSRSLGGRLSSFLRNESWLNAFKMGPREMDRFVDRINAVQPDLIYAYPGSLYELSLFCRRHKRSVHSPRSVMVSASKLDDEMRKTIEGVFDCGVFDRYGAREVGPVACECEAHGGLHVCPLTNYVEILKPDGSRAKRGEEGELALTTLVNRAMPLIRFRIGDTGAWAEEPCPCGLSWPLLERIGGRVTSNFVSANGSIVHGDFFRQLLYNLDWVQKFQIVQEEIDRIRIRVVARSGSGAPNTDQSQDMDEVRLGIGRAMGASCDVDFEFLSSIEPTPEGKHRPVVSRVRSP